MTEDGRVDLSRVPGVTVAYDEASQSVDLRTGEANRTARLVDASGRKAGQVPDRSALAAVLNYDVIAATSGTGGFDWKSERVSGAFEGKVFSPYGVFSTGVLASSGGRADLIRTDTTWTYPDPAHLMTDRAGDFISSGLSWTRPVRLGGVQVERDFASRPDLVTMALPSVSGSAAVPSAVDVYTNDVKSYSGDVLAGPFTIASVPAVNGAGTARMVVHDLLGRTTVTEVPFFVSSKLLAEGRLDFSAEAGFPRRSYGISSFDYDDDFAGSASARYGVSDKLTLEGHAEGDAQLANGSVAADVLLGSFGVATLGGSASFSGDGPGGQARAALDLGRRGVALHLSAEQSLGAYEDLAYVASDLSRMDRSARLQARPARSTQQAVLSIPLGFDPSVLNASYGRSESEGGIWNQTFGLSYGRSLMRRTSFQATVSYGQSGGGEGQREKDNLAFLAGIDISLGSDMNASASLSGGDGDVAGRAELSRTAKDEVGGFGWRVGGQEGRTEQAYANGTYRSSVASLQAGVSEDAGSFSGYAEASGAVAAADHQLFLSQPIEDSFAVVDVGAPGVPVAAQSRKAGTTNSRGTLLVPDLVPYEPNRITIDNRKLPVDAAIPETAKVVTPRPGSGTVVKFGVREAAQSAVVAISDRNGTLLPPGLGGQLNDGEAFVIGYDGQAYLSGLGARNHLTVTLDDGTSCAASFPFKPDPGRQVVIGPVACLPSS
ncbi:fimbria/pilus outer membrane usher protein [Faunimonas pinastri]|nr:fimbria/pilus outer membrane usher protein [Faunimonas pinastri]